jgi:hypothetical protein
MEDDIHKVLEMGTFLLKYGKMFYTVDFNLVQLITANKFLIKTKKIQ